MASYQGETILPYKTNLTTSEVFKGKLRTLKEVPFQVKMWILVIAVLVCIAQVILFSVLVMHGPKLVLKWAPKTPETTKAVSKVKESFIKNDTVKDFVKSELDNLTDRMQMSSLTDSAQEELVLKREDKALKVDPADLYKGRMVIREKFNQFFNLTNILQECVKELDKLRPESLLLSQEIYTCLCSHRF
jgi:hypothetical protein